MLTFQKINPLIMLNYNNSMNFLFMFIIMSLIIGTLTGLNYSSLKKMISFSSINQLSWLMISLININLMKIYLMIYFFIMFSITKSLNFYNFKLLNQIYNLPMKMNFFKLFIFMNFLSLGGLPPFLGFFPKMMIMMKLNNLFIIFLLIMMSLITLFMYFRIIYSMLMLNSMLNNKIMTKNNYSKKNNLMKLNMINNLMLMIMFFMF